MLRSDFSVSTQIAGFYDELNPYSRMTLWGFEFDLYDYKSNTFLIIALIVFTIFVVSIYFKYKSIQGLEVNKGSLLLRIKDIGMPNFPIYNEN